MKNTVLTNGLISGAIAAALMLGHMPFMDGSGGVRTPDGHRIMFGQDLRAREEPW